jgi:hypothetical protein
MIRKAKKRLAEHKINLLSAETSDPYKHEKAMEKINDARSKAEVENMDNQEIINKRIDREVHKEIRAGEKAIFEAGKGIRGSLKFNIIDEAIIPRDFFTLDETKIRSYANINKERIEKDLQQNTETIPGLKFYYDESYVVQ